MNGDEKKGSFRLDYSAPTDDERREIESIRGKYLPQKESATEMDKLRAEAAKYAIQEEDVLTYAMFPQVAPKFFEKRNARIQGVDALHADYEKKGHPV